LAIGIESVVGSPSAEIQFKLHLENAWELIECKFILNTILNYCTWALFSRGEEGPYLAEGRSQKLFGWGGAK